jgi:hypothetical protein
MMPDVHLTRGEANGDLPAACMCCGKPASVWVERTFMKHEPGVQGPSGFQEIYVLRLLIAVANTPTFQLRTSFCDEHRYYWQIRNFVTFGSLAGLFVVLFGGLAFTILLIAVIVGPDAPWVGACAIVPVLVYIFGVLIPLKLLVVSRIIRARNTEDDGVELSNVGEGYVAALKKHREMRTLVPVAKFAPPLDQE